MRIGINHVPEHSSPEEWAQILTKKGYRAASFPVDYKAPQNLIDGYVKAADEYDIMIAEVGVWDSPHHPNLHKKIEVREKCLEQFRLAEYVKARCCVNVSGAAGPEWYYCYQENFTPELYEENVKLIQWLCDTVQPQYTKFTFEPMQWMLPDSPKQYARFLKDVDRKGMAVHMDLVNMITNPYIYVHMKDLIDETFSLLGNQIRSCHIKDCLLELGASVVIREVPIGKGMMENSYYLQKISQLKEDIPVLLEHMPEIDAYDKPFHSICELLSRLEENDV